MSDLVELDSDSILLPCEWVLYLYNKSAFKKMADKSDGYIKPYRQVAVIKTVNDLIYILQLMKVPTKTNLGTIKINLNMNDYIFMRKGIEPIWEDVKNSNGGTFSIKVKQEKSYDYWMHFVIYIMGETLSNEMQYINGITISNLSNFSCANDPVTGSSFSLLKIWDGKSNRDNFIESLCDSIQKKIIGVSTLYTLNNTKKNYGDKNIVNKLRSTRGSNGSNGSRMGGFRRKNR